MARDVERGAKAGGAQTRLKKVNEMAMEDMSWADGWYHHRSPTYFGLPAHKELSKVRRLEVLLLKIPS